MKDYLKARFNAGEESGMKADPQQVAVDMRNARKEENKRLFSREDWLSRNQIESYFSRLSVLKKKQTTTPFSGQATEVVDAVDIEDVQEKEWLQQVDEVCQKPISPACNLLRCL